MCRPKIECGLFVDRHEKGIPLSFSGAGAKITIRPVLTRLLSTRPNWIEIILNSSVFQVKISGKMKFLTSRGEENILSPFRSL